MKTQIASAAHVHAQPAVARQDGFARSPGLPTLAIDDSTIEVLKWLGLVLMTVDHVNKYLFNGVNDAAFAAGRMAMPIFAFALAYNLARPGAIARHTYRRTCRRLMVFGLLAMLPFLALGGLLWNCLPMNILFTFLTATSVIWSLDRGSPATACLVFLFGGALVEYWWPALGFTVAVWCYARSPSWRSLLLATLCCASLRLINGNWWAMAALPILWASTRISFAPMPRFRWAFYAYYPMHLAALWHMRIPMRKAGYLFF